MEIVEYVYNDKNVNEAINKIVDLPYRDDFKSHFIEQVTNIKEDKLKSLHKDGELFWYLLKIITNQWDMRSQRGRSTFWKIYSDNNLEYMDDINEDVIEEDNEIDMIKIKRDIDILLDNQYDNWQLNNYHKTLFKMYYYDNMTLKQIEKDTDVDFNAVCRSVRKTKNWIKTKILK